MINAEPLLAFTIKRFLSILVYHVLSVTAADCNQRPAIARGRGMSRLSKLALVACAGAVATVPMANAADLTPPIPAATLKGWYLRGDIGYSNQLVDHLDNALYDTALSVDNLSKDFTGAPFIDAGIGYRINNWFRVDVTGEYRSKS